MLATVVSAELDCFYEAELLRLRAECLRRKEDVEAARRGFTQALDLARQQSAALYAARAARSLQALEHPLYGPA